MNTEQPEVRLKMQIDLAAFNQAVGNVAESMRRFSTAVRESGMIEILQRIEPQKRPRPKGKLPKRGRYLARQTWGRG